MTASLRTPITTFSSTYAALDVADVDTDQIIPARYLTTTERDGLGKFAFNDWRYLADGSPNPDFVLNKPNAAGANVLVAGRNFGCGSSREHAVWALMSTGFRAVISSAFADIFRGNALGNGLLPVQLDEKIVNDLLARGGGNVTVNLVDQTVTLPDRRTVKFSVPPFAKHCLINGVDELGFLLDASDDVARYERTRAPR
jgi:3-isopropylmalate/(R)-2-methylmalate dehydratase small subunit